MSIAAPTARVRRAVLTLSFVAGALAYPRLAMAIEEPDYTVVATYPGFEVRAYPSTIVAETFVDEDMDRAGDEGFRRLAGYIFGGNRGARRIDMTAPVAMEPVKIAMTAPVTVAPADAAAGGPLAGAKRYRVTFTMPRAFTLDTLPVPDDARVVLREEPARRVAALRFSGRWTDTLAAAKTRELLAAVDGAGLHAAGPPVYARYDPPWTLPWKRRNEILVPLK